jgi:hypothetical protein
LGTSRTVATVSNPLGRSLISNGQFRQGEWRATANCNNYSPQTSKNQLGGQVVARLGPNRLPALSLYASIDSACQSQLLAWRGGDFLLRYSSRSLSGSSPRICLWEEPIGKCATITSAPSSGSTWATNSSIVVPDSGTKTIQLTAYADAIGKGKMTVTQYADFVVRSIPVDSSAFLLGLPKQAPAPFRLVIGPDGFSTATSGPPGAVHVVVNGLRNGWLINHWTVTDFSIYSQSSSRRLWTMALCFSAAMLIVAGTLAWGDRRRLRRQSDNEAKSP